MDVLINHVGMSLYLDLEHAEYDFHETICSYFNLEERVYLNQRYRGAVGYNKLCEKCWSIEWL